MLPYEVRNTALNEFPRSSVETMSLLKHFTIALWHARGFSYGPCRPAFPKFPLELRTVHANQALLLSEVHNIISGAVEIERRFICEALSCDIICMNSDMMVKYVVFVADRQLAVLPPLNFAELFHTDDNMLPDAVAGLLVCAVLGCVFVEYLLPEYFC